MVNARIALLLAAAALVRAEDPANRLTPAEVKAGWKLLFDGKSLAGWEPLSTSSPSTTGDWTFADGAILCPGTSPGWLASSDAYTNYTLKLEFRGGAQVNSGVFLRSQRAGQPHITGYELQIWDHQPAGFNTGSLVGSVKAEPVKILPDQWNRYEITANGDHFVINLNGKTVLDAHDSKHVSSGLVGFQCQKDNKIEFRNIRLLPLKP